MDETRYAAMGVAALIPGMQHMLDRMQAELDDMRAQLGRLDQQRLATRRVRKPDRPKSSFSKGMTSFWGRMTADERSAEIIRRRSVTQAKRQAKQARQQAEGKPLGRPKGAANAQLKLDAHADAIRGYLAKGMSKRSIAKLVGCAESTLYDWVARRVTETRSSATNTRK